MAASGRAGDSRGGKGEARDAFSRHSRRARGLGRADGGKRPVIQHDQRVRQRVRVGYSRSGGELTKQLTQPVAVLLNRQLLGLPCRRFRGSVAKRATAKIWERHIFGDRIEDRQDLRVRVGGAALRGLYGKSMTETEQRHKALVMAAFDALFNKRDYVAAQRFWAPDYIQHSAHIPPGREGLFRLVKASPPDMRYENAVITANGDYVILHGRFRNVGRPADWIVAEIVRIQDGLLAEHRDVIQDEATAEESQSGLPMFGDAFPAQA
jgi:predicted SnoaL-like aldol condensation-catalyzing enzyme